MSINVTRSSMPGYEEYCEEIKELWNSRWLTNMGTKHREFQAQLEEYLSAPNVTLYTNGHLALENILEAMNFKKGGEVITTPFTFVSTTSSIVRSGLKPVFCDINPFDYTIDVSLIESLINENTVAIMPVHVYGSLCDVETIDKIAKKYNLKVIYDAAHAFGVTYKGISSACFGDASMFSFHATKVFHTIEGGALCYKDESLKDKLDDLKNFGLRGEEGNYVGGNAKMNEFQAAMGICNLRHLKEEIEKRKKAFDRYVERLGNIKGIKLLEIKDGTEHNYAYFPAVFDGFKKNRDQVFNELKCNDIISRKYFHPLTSDYACYKGLYRGETPVAKDVASKILTLPLFADLTPYEVDKICDIILN